jgi:hypothetical protein
MFLTKKHLSRRTVLRGAGAAIALPLLDAMIPAHTALANTAAAPKTRLGFVYFPHGAVMQDWTPKQTGRDFEFTRILEPLAPLREYVTVVSGCRNKGGENGTDPHGNMELSWLSCIGPNNRDPASERGVTADQIAVRHIGQDTPLPSLELCTEPGGYSSLCYRTPVQQMPMEGNPRRTFYQLFGQGDTNEARRSILKKTGSLLDYVREETASLNGELDASDRAIVNDYLDSVREIERRVQKLQASKDMSNLPDAPLGAPDDFTELLDVQFEMMALAWQTDQTRVITFRMVNEVTMRVYSFLNLTEAFHPLSHHGNDPEKFEKLVRVQSYHTGRMAKFVNRLKSIKDGDGTLLDNAVILFGSNMSNSDTHNNDPLPSAIIGRGAGSIKGGQHLKYPQDTPHANLLVTVLQRAGVPTEKLADSTGMLSEI